MRYDEAIGKRLRGLPLFEGLGHDDVVSIVRVGHERRVAAGDPLFSEGEEGREMYVVLEGRIGLRKEDPGGGGGWSVTQLDPGAILGEMALLTNEPRSLTAIALTETRLLALGRADFERLTAETGAIAVQVLRNLAIVIAHRLRKMDQELLRFYRETTRRDAKVGEALRMKDEILSQ